MENKPTYEELEALAQIAKILLKDVSERLDYNYLKVRQASSPILPISLAWHYKQVLEPYTDTIKKLG